MGTKAYGQMSEADMIKELRSRGPFLLDFNANASFGGYSSGILEEEVPTIEQKIESTQILAQIKSDSEN